MTAEQEVQVHLPLVTATCPSGHSNKTQKQSGSKLRCSRCYQERGKTVLVTVPDRGGPGAPRPAPEKKAPEVPPAPRPPASCRSCGAKAPPGRLPDGWMSVMVSADPARTKYGKPFRRLGPYCCLACVVSSLKGETGQMAGVPVRPGGAEDLRSLMIRPPAGADRD